MHAELGLVHSPAAAAVIRIAQDVVFQAQLSHSIGGEGDGQPALDVLVLLRGVGRGVVLVGLHTARLRLAKIPWRKRDVR